MKSLIAFLLLAMLAVNSGNGQAIRPTRAPVQNQPGPTRQQVNPSSRSPLPTPSRVPPGQTNRPGPTTRAPPPGQTTRQPLPTPSRAPPPGPTARPPPNQTTNRGPPMPTGTRATPPGGNQTPPRTTTTQRGQPPTRTTTRPVQTRPTVQTPSVPDDGVWIPTRPNPNPQPIPTVPTIQPPNGGRPATRPPRIGLEGRPDPRCPPHNAGRIPVMLPHEFNCERFYKCDSGLAFEFQCQVGQHWNTARNYCDFPNLANCGGNNWNNGNNNNWNNNWNNGNNWNNVPNIPIAPNPRPNPLPINPNPIPINPNPIPINPIPIPDWSHPIVIPVAPVG